MPATCLRDGRRCLPAYVNICSRRNADTSPTLKHCRRQIVEVELNLIVEVEINSPDRSPSPLRRNACLRLVCDVYFYVNSCRRDGADKVNVISQKSAAGLQ